jgi:hypothetical protein
MAGVPRRHGGVVAHENRMASWVFRTGEFSGVSTHGGPLAVMVMYFAVQSLLFDHSLLSAAAMPNTLGGYNGTRSVRQ